jgi:hypothetical protein
LSQPAAPCLCSPCEAARFAHWAGLLRAHTPEDRAFVRRELCDSFAYRNPDGGLVIDLGYVLSCLGSEDDDGDDEAAEHLDEMVYVERESQRLNPVERCPRETGGADPEKEETR